MKKHIFTYSLLTVVAIVSCNINAMFIGAFKKLPQTRTTTPQQKLYRLFPRYSYMDFQINPYAEFTPEERRKGLWREPSFWERFLRKPRQVLRPEYVELTKDQLNTQTKLKKYYALLNEIEETIVRQESALQEKYLYEVGKRFFRPKNITDDYIRKFLWSSDSNEKKYGNSLQRYQELEQLRREEMDKIIVGSRGTDPDSMREGLYVVRKRDVE